MASGIDRQSSDRNGAEEVRDEILAPEIHDVRPTLFAGKDTVDSSPTNLDSCPDEVALAAWAIAAGGCGQVLQLEYRGYPARVMAKLIRRLMTWVDDEAYFDVECRKDVRLLRKNIAQARLVLVRQPQFAAEVAWALAMRRCAGTSPVTIVIEPEPIAPDSPIDVLKFVGFPAKIETLDRWLDSDSTSLSLPELPAALPTFDPRVEGVLSGTMPSASRDCVPEAIRRTFRSLLIGASLFEHSRHDSCVGSDPFGEYSRVQRRLSSPSIQSESEYFDPLATRMVHRANVYLQGCRAAPTGSAEPETSGTAHSVITRRELLDLGNVRGKTVRELVQRLLAQGAPGYRTFRYLGMNQTWPESADWPDISPEHLALRLLPWSEKQVRNHFHSLVTRGLLVAKRRSFNKPWEYVLPERLADPRSPFRDLPSVAELTAERRAEPEGRPPLVRPLVEADRT